MDESVCKTRWANIRDNFRKSLNKQKTKSRQQAYKYSEQLSFLKKFFEERETKTNIEIYVNIDDFSAVQCQYRSRRNRAVFIFIYRGRRYFLDFTLTVLKTDDEKLFVLVEENSVLYDLKHPKYINTQFKEKIWKNIGEQLKQSGADCKARWSNIRDNYRKSKKRRMTKSGRAAVKTKKYKYEDQLGFLLPYMEERATYSNVSENGTQTIPDESDTQTFANEDDIDDNQNQVTADHAETREEFDDTKNSVNNSDDDPFKTPTLTDKTANYSTSKKK
ncbi:uncharacterized protein LOC115890955 [Sitophilus oryzae]|uniref:Uncharacterized protein LOC115890955 n=1 Tax=Sitophilus oryzae TaxID=7048 RepID=A0A6J2YVG6_SITOR|nr:uncharacterized protein LOC115890955 [Sitophilus oryzae]